MEDIQEEVVEIRKPIRLRFPAVEWNSTTYDTMTLHEPDISTILKAQKEKDPLDAAVVMIREVTGLPQQVVLKLPQAVLARAGDFFAPFTPPSPEGGEG